MENTRDFDLLALGELLLRLSPAGNERLVRGENFQKQVGGAELNVVSGSALLGLRTGIISKLPANDIGRYVTNRVRLGIYYYEYGAHPRKPNVVYDRKYTTINSVSPDDFPEEMYSSARCFHTTGITLALSKQARETGVEMIKRFKEHGTLISFDVNFRANLWTGDEARECIEKILPYVDVFFCSEETARLTFGKEGNVQDIMKSFAAEYPLSVVASTQRVVHSPKIHSFGSIVYDVKKDVFYQERAYENIEVVDRIGSGDAYISGALYGLLKYDMDCEKAMVYGNATAAVKNTIPGDLPSSDLKEINNIIRSHNTVGRQSEMNR